MPNLTGHRGCVTLLIDQTVTGNKKRPLGKKREFPLTVWSQRYRLDKSQVPSHLAFFMSPNCLHSVTKSNELNLGQPLSNLTNDDQQPASRLGLAQNGAGVWLPLVQTHSNLPPQSPNNIPASPEQAL